MAGLTGARDTALRAAMLMLMKALLPDTPEGRDRVQINIAEITSLTTITERLCEALADDANPVLRIALVQFLACAAIEDTAMRDELLADYLRIVRVLVGFPDE